MRIREKKLNGVVSSRHRPRTAALLAAAAVVLSGSSVLAGTATYNFDTDPSTDPNLVIAGNNDQTWQAAGGVAGGFLALTYPQNDQNAFVVFPDIDNGTLVKAFKFEADLRVGNSSGDRPADGFSISFARSNDPLLSALPGSVSTYGNFAGGAPENGSTTGIAVIFDTWSGNALPDGADIEGIIVRVDNVTVLRQGLPTRHGECADTTSLQTGPRDAAYWAGGGDPRAPESWAGLCWQPFSVEVSDAAKLTVKYKGATILDQFQTSYFPSVSRLILAGRTGGANEHTHIDNIRITTTAADAPIVGLPSGNPCGIQIRIADAGTVSPQQNTIAVTVDGQAITPSISRTGSETLLVIPNTGAFFAPGSTHPIVVSFTSSNGQAVSATRSFVVPAAAVIPATAKATTVNTSTSGFTARIHQMELTRGPGDANTIVNAEHQLVGGFIDPATGQPAENVADLSGATGGLFTVDTINWSQFAAEVNNASPYNDNFNSEEPTANPQANVNIPGVPGTGTAGDSADNIVAEMLTFLELKRGCYTLGVNSDDGFKVSLGHSPFGPVLGSYNGGRGASDTLFTIVVEEDGVYPIRLAWWEGGGGANVEFFSVTPTGEKILINDRSNANAIKAYSAGTVPAYLESINPYPGQGGIATTPTVKVVFQDGSTTVDDASIKLFVDGTQVTATPSNSGAETTVQFTPTTPFAFNSQHTGRVEYAIGGVVSTQTFSFTVRNVLIGDFPNGFSIEAEHFDFDGGQMVPAVNTMPYEGGEYNGLGAVHLVDYMAPDFGPFTNGNPDGYNYRTGIPAEQNGPGRFVPMDSNATAGTLDTQRPGGWEVTTNYKIGWVGNEWYNYTRTIPAGNYRVIGVQSHGNAAGEANRLRTRYGIVASGAGTDTQEVVQFGSYSQPATGGWGANAISVVNNSSGQPAVIRLGGTQTLRVWVDEGDFDWFALIPTTEPTSPPGVVSADPTNGGGALDIPAINVTLSDILNELKINFSTIKISVDGADVTSTATITDTAVGATVSFTPATAFASGVHTYSVTFRDSGGTDRTYNATFTVINNPGNFVIEAEDFNYDSGQTKAEASVMPLQSGLYDGLSAVHDVDYHLTANTPDSNQYRLGENPNTPITPQNGDLDRGPFNVASNYRIGWVDTGEWYNYTRTFPAGAYNVYAAISKDGGTMGGRLGVVDSATTATQNVTEVGTFQAPASPGWGISRFVTLRDTAGNPAVVTLSGTKTIRYTADFGNGDLDFLIFVPTGAVDEVRISGISRSGNQVTITWTGGGTLETSPVVTGGTWTSTGDSDGSYTTAASEAAAFFRVRK